MSEPAIGARGVTVIRGGNPVVDGVDLDLHFGRVMVVLGPNGAGKSSLLRALAGLLPASGEIAIEGRAAASLTAAERALRMAFVPQRSRLDAPLPVHRVIAQGRFLHRGFFGSLRAADREAVDRAMTQVDVAELRDRPFTALSEGERRRVILARALATGARVLLLDEPTAALDVRHALELYALVRQLAASGYAVLLVLHSLDDARRVADDALLLDRGRVVRGGAPDEVIAAEPVRAVYGVHLEEGAAVGFRLPEGEQ